MELLSPAGDLGKLKLAFLYGADAVYFGVGDFSLRAIKLGLNELEEGIQYAHKLGKKIYVTANVFMHNADIEKFIEYFKEIERLGADGVIVSDFGAARLALEHCPSVDLHISTQANITNWQTVVEYQKLGAKRVILARELTFDEIAEIKRKVPEMEIEVFIHGALCMAYSGRCVLSQYLTARDANKGMCSQPCRWNYKVKLENVQGEEANELELEEDARGTYIFNSRDLCLIDKLEKLREIGVTSVKIEGRNKSEYYVAAATKTYRTALDDGYRPELLDELGKISHREFLTNPSEITSPSGENLIHGTSSYQKTMDVVGLVIGHDGENLKIEQRNKILAGDKLEIMQPIGENISIDKALIFDEDMQELESTPHAKMVYYLACKEKVVNGSFIRCKS